MDKKTRFHKFRGDGKHPSAVFRIIAPSCSAPRRHGTMREALVPPTSGSRYDPAILIREPFFRPGFSGLGPPLCRVTAGAIDRGKTEEKVFNSGFPTRWSATGRDLIAAIDADPKFP